MKKVAITLGCVCLILTIAIYIQINTVNSITNEEGISLNGNAELKGEVLRWRQASKDIYKELEDAETKLEETMKIVDDLKQAYSAAVKRELEALENQIKKSN